MAIIYHKQKQVLAINGVDITDEICEEFEQSKSDPKYRTVSIASCRGPLGQLVSILLSKGSSCSDLYFFSMDMTADVELEHIGRAIGASANLRNLRISGTDFRRNGMTLLASLGLEQANKNLEIFQLANVSWHEQDDEALGRALWRNQHLQTLQVTRCNQSDSRIATLLHGLEDHPSVKMVQFIGSKFGPESSTALAEAIRSPNSQLQELYLESVAGRRSNATNRLDIEVISNALKQNKSLRLLDLSDNMIDDEGLDLLAASLMTRCDDEEETGTDEETDTRNYNSTLQTLVLTRNSITDEGLSRLLYQWLPRIHSLQNLTLSGSLFEDLGNGRTNSTGRASARETGRILRNRAIKAMIDAGEVELIKAAALPEHTHAGLWPMLLSRVQRLRETKKSSSLTKTEDLLYLMLRGPIAPFLNLASSTD